MVDLPYFNASIIYTPKCLTGKFTISNICSELVINGIVSQEHITVKATATNFKYDIKGSLDCQTSNVVYLLLCNKCSDQYVGQTEKTLSKRFLQHRGYVNNKKLDKSTGHHFNQAGHSISDMRINIIEKVYSRDPQMREIRESHYIKEMNTFHRGMNRRK